MADMTQLAYKKKKFINKENVFAFLFVVIPIIGFLIFTVASMGFSVYSSFTWFNVRRETTKWVGWKNYSDLINGTYKEDFFESIGNTLIFLVTLPIGMMIGLLLATYLKKISHGSRLIRLIYYLPAVSSAVAINLIFRYMFDNEFGLINTVLQNLFHTSIPWLGVSKVYIKFAIMIKAVWGGIGGTMLLYLAGLNAIPDSYYEAARIDGASEVRQFFRITLPLVNPTSFYLIITGIIGGLQSYNDAKVFAQGHKGARTIVYFIWEYGINQKKYGYAAAASTILGIAIMIITFIQFKFTHMVDLGDREKKKWKRSFSVKKK